LEAAKAVAGALGVVEHRIAQIDLRVVGGSALTDDIEVPKDRSADEMSEGIPVTYVPARNTIFLSFALGWAEVLGAADIFLGVNAVDYSGYPDCRPRYIEAFETMANLATRMGVEGRRITVHKPLIELTKAGIIRRGLELGVDYGLTFSCYDPDPSTGRPCDHCDACLLRARGFQEAGVADPIRPAG
jgi:7-cyano-7-deazaguanine synthase